jgi:hypothetical protein
VVERGGRRTGLCFDKVVAAQRIRVGGEIVGVTHVGQHGRNGWGRSLAAMGEQSDRSV